MPVPTHFKFTARGVFTGTPEAWSFGFHFGRTVGEGGDAGIEDVSDSGVTSAFSTLFSSLNGPSIMSVVKMTDWRCYVIGTDGRAEDLKVVDVSGDNIVGAGSYKAPPQLAVAVTLVADERGPGKYGRFYLPGLLPAIAADLRMSATDAQFIGQKVSAFLKNVSDAIDLPGTLLSASAVNVSTRGDVGGSIQQIDHVEVGRAIDTLRSRRRSLLEDREADAQIDW